MTIIGILIIPMTLWADDNVINIQTPTASNDLDLTVEQRGYDQETYFSIGGADNTIDILQTGANNTIKWTDTWGSGFNWGGDLDGTDNALTIKQNTTTGNNPTNNYFGFHIQGNNNTVKLLDFISEIEKNINKTAKKDMLPIQDGDVFQTYADVSEFMEEFDYVPTTSIMIGVAKFVNWFINNKNY